MSSSGYGRHRDCSPAHNSFCWLSDSSEAVHLPRTMMECCYENYSFAEAICDLAASEGVESRPPKQKCTMHQSTVAYKGCFSMALSVCTRVRPAETYQRRAKSAPSSCTSTSEKEKRPRPSQTGHTAAEDSQHRKPSNLENGTSESNPSSSKGPKCCCIPNPNYSLN